MVNHEANEGANSLPATFVNGFHDADTVKKMEYRKLGGDTGLVVSKLSLGLSALGSVYRKTDDEESYNVVELAIMSGINWIDTAPWYGNGKSEMVLGQALKKKKIPRNAYYLATKVGRYEPEVSKMFNFTAKRVIESVTESLERIGVDYIDVIQIHDMEFAPSIDMIINETLPALQKLKDIGKVKYIGITGYPLDLFNILPSEIWKRDVIERSHIKIDTILTYCHYSLNDTSLLDYIDYFKSKGIGIINASPTSMGLLTNRGPPVWHPATEDIKAPCKLAAEYCQNNDVDVATLALYFTCGNNNIPTTLVSTASIENMKSNIDICCRKLTDKEQGVLDEVIERYFLPLKNKTWEEIEVKEYWENMKKLSE